MTTMGTGGGSALCPDYGLGAGLHQREVQYLVEQEWARSADDILWRRSKLGLRLNAGQIEALDEFVRERLLHLQSNRSDDAPLREAG